MQLIFILKMLTFPEDLKKMDSSSEWRDRCGTVMKSDEDHDEGEFEDQQIK